MRDLASFFVDQAQACKHIHFIYELTTQRVIFINAAYEQVLGGNCARVNEELPALVARLHPDDLQLWRYYWRLWTNGQLQDEVELRLLVENQPAQWFCLTPYWHQHPDGQRWLGGRLADISINKQHQANSEKFNAKKNTILEMLSHDLAGNFAILEQLADYIGYEMEGNLNPRVAEMLGLVRTTSQRGTQLIHDLVNQELQEAASVALKRERVDLAAWLEQSLEPYHRLPGNESRQLLFELPEAPVYVEVDINKMLQVVSNLVHNAFKFTPDKGHIFVNIAPFDGVVLISVTDEGIGIPAHLLPGLFERYTTARRRGLRGEPTTGLGLWLCKTIVELHQGTLSVNSAEGQGTTFTVELPR